MTANNTVRLPTGDAGTPLRDIRKTGLDPDFWYPVAHSREIKPGKAHAAAFAGQAIVLVRGKEGRVFALEDRCAHRQVPLHVGEVVPEGIKCGYHGWTYDPSGKCVLVPQQKDATRAGRFSIQTFRAAARYGYVWVCLDDEPLADIPAIDEADDPAYRLIPQFYELWNCAGLRLMENSFDNAHVAFTHRESFGMQEQPDPGEIDLEETPGGLVMRSALEVAI